MKRYLIMPLLLLLSACCDTSYLKQQKVKEAFKDQVIEIKCTANTDLFIVRCQDGSIWQVEITDTGAINHKDCLFDALYQLPPKPIAPVPPPVALEK